MTTEEYKQTIKAILAAVSSLEKAVTIQQEQIEDLQKQVNKQQKPIAEAIADTRFHEADIKKIWNTIYKLKDDIRNDNRQE